MLKKLVFTTLVVAVAISTSARAGTTCVSMGQQINIDDHVTAQSPYGNAIYPYPPANPERLSFETDGVDKWARCSSPGAAYLGIYLDLGLTTIGSVDLSQPGASMSFDARFFQDPQTNTNPYGDAPIFAKLYNYSPDGNTLLGSKDFSIVYATQAPWNNPPFPTWTRVTVKMTDAGTADSGWDPTKITRVRFLATDWAGTGKDFIDIKNVCFDSGGPVIPEPGSMALLLTGALPFVAKLRRRKA